MNAMNYIFFDIECANCTNGQAKICSFGYVITDTDFNVLEKTDLIVNPRAPFMLSGRKNRPYIKLAYDSKDFRSAPDFRRVYEDVDDLLSRTDCLIFGYAADNDAAYLKSEFLRYHLPCIDFTYYDLQKLLRFVRPDLGSNQISLSTAAALFMGEEVHQDIHKSDDDAYLTMQVLKGLCRETRLPAVKLLEKYPVCRGDLEDNKIYIRVLEGQNLLVRVLGDRSERIAPKSENRKLYIRFIRHVKPSGEVRPQWLKGKRVCIPEKYAERHYTDAVKLIQLVCDCGGRYSLVPEGCHFFVLFPIYNDDGTPKECAEALRIQNDSQAKAKFLSPEEFFELCAMDAEEFSALPVPEIKYLLEERYAQAPKVQKPRRRAPKKNRERVTIIPEKK